MDWLIWYDNLVEIVLIFPTYLRSPKSEFRWRIYDQNTNHCAADLSPYGSYGNAYDPTRMLHTRKSRQSCQQLSNWLASYIRTLQVSFSMIRETLAAIFKFGNVASKFERDLAPQGAEFEILHAESKSSSESLNLIFSSLVFRCYVPFYCFKFLLFALEHAWLITLLGVMACSTWIFLVKPLGIRSF
jgi:hypothetical protein